MSCIFDFVQWIDTILSKEVERRKRGMLKKILLFVSTAIWLAPFVLMLLIAFSSKNTNSFLELFADNRATFQNFQNAWEQAEFSRYFLNTVIVTVVSVVVILAVTALAGYIMGCFEFRAKKIIYTVMMISMGIPTIFFTIPVYQILRMLHCESSLIGLILAEVGGGHVIFILLFSKFFQSIPKALEESAVLEGRVNLMCFSESCFRLRDR